MASVPNYIKRTLRMTPTVKQIYEDLEAFHNWVRMQDPLIKFDEADLYKNSSPTWQKYQKHLRKQRARQNG